MLSESDILTALRDCFDPEVKLNLVDLGLIYSVATGPDPDSTPAWPRQWVKVTMTLTTPQCPASGLIFEQVHNRLAGIPDIGKVDVDLVWEPKWTPHRISEAGRRQLGIEGLLHLLCENPMQLLPLGVEIVQSDLHLAEEPLHVVEVAGKRPPPGAQRFLLIEERQGCTGGSRHGSGAAPAREQQKAACDQGSGRGKPNPIHGFIL